MLQFQPPKSQNIGLIKMNINDRPVHMLKAAE